MKMLRTLRETPYMANIFDNGECYENDQQVLQCGQEHLDVLNQNADSDGRRGRNGRSTGVRVAVAGLGVAGATVGEIFAPRSYKTTSNVHEDETDWDQMEWS